MGRIKGSRTLSNSFSHVSSQPFCTVTKTKVQGKVIYFFLRYCMYYDTICYFFETVPLVTFAGTSKNTVHVYCVLCTAFCKINASLKAFLKVVKCKDQKFSFAEFESGIH